MLNVLAIPKFPEYVCLTAGGSLLSLPASGPDYGAIRAQLWGLISHNITSTGLL